MSLIDRASGKFGHRDASAVRAFGVCVLGEDVQGVCKAMELALGYCGHRLSAQAEKKYNDELELKLKNRMKGVK
jgi:hypothetical protein